MVVLVNQGTASASKSWLERYDYDRAEIEEQTFGKGSVQRVHEFDDGLAAADVCPVADPEKRTIEGEGLAPDVEVQAVDDPEGVDEHEAAAIEQATQAAS